MNTRQQALSYRLGWRLAILRAPQLPDHVAHLQFKHANPPGRAHGLLRDWVGALASVAQGRVDYFAAVESGTEDPAHIHLHVLLWGAHPAMRRDMERRWKCASSRVATLVAHDRRETGSVCWYPDPDEAAERLEMEHRLQHRLAQVRQLREDAVLGIRRCHGTARREARAVADRIRAQESGVRTELAHTRRAVRSSRPTGGQGTVSRRSSPLVWQVIYTTKRVSSSADCFFSRTLKHRLSKPPPSRIR